MKNGIVGRPCVAYAVPAAMNDRHRAGFRDAFFEDLAVLRFLVVEQRVAVDRLVELTARVSRCRPAGRALPCRRCGPRRARSGRRACQSPRRAAASPASDEHHRRRDLAVAVPARTPRRLGSSIGRDARLGRLARRHEPAERLRAGECRYCISGCLRPAGRTATCASSLFGNRDREALCGTPSARPRSASSAGA